ncbi:hypothetical protein HYQ44_005279 [Verticillium longisporum]|nr:hypothetical protein HYQ44_005279 [Verticillium longisporum]
MADACHSCVLVRSPSRESPVTTTERVRLVYAWRGGEDSGPPRPPSSLFSGCALIRVVRSPDLGQKYGANSLP